MDKKEPMEVWQLTVKDSSFSEYFTTRETAIEQAISTIKLQIKVDSNGPNYARVTVPAIEYVITRHVVQEQTTRKRLGYED